MRNYLIVTGAYWGFTLTDGALRMLVLLHFYQLGYTPFTLAFLFLLYEAAGILVGYRAEIDLARVGLSIIAFIRMSTPRERSGYVGRQLQDIPEILECHRVAGKDSFLMKVAVSSMDHLERLIDQLAQYGQSTTSIVLSSPVISRVVEAKKD